jgi:hypothetical protein
MAAILNEDLDWRRIVAAYPDVGRAFRGTPERKLVQARGMLCRFITTESKKKGIRGNEIFKSPWWMDWAATIAMVTRFKAARVTDVIRARMAVPKAFSQELDSLAQIILTRPVYAWKGIARHQNDDAQGITYIGGGEQYYLPNLASDANGLSSSVAYLHCFTSVDSLS